VEKKRHVNLGSVNLQASDYLLDKRRRLAKLGVDVVLQPGRAVLQNPQEPYTVTIEFSFNAKTGQAKREAVILEGEVPETLGLGPYFQALALKILSEPFASGRLYPPKDRPRPGQPVNRDFYLQVVKLYNRYRNEGNNQPAAAVARLMNEPAERVRLWVHRGQKYLEPEES
jgi:hypothetical protein